MSTNKPVYSIAVLELVCVSFTTIKKVFLLILSRFLEFIAERALIIIRCFGSEMGAGCQVWHEKSHNGIQIHLKLNCNVFLMTKFDTKCCKFCCHLGSQRTNVDRHFFLWRLTNSRTFCGTINVKELQV